MKKAAKVFIIIDLILGFVFIVPPIIGIMTLKRLKVATSRSQMVKWGILNIILCSTVGGILILCMRDSHYAAAAPAVEEKSEAPAVEDKVEEAPAVAEEAAPAADEPKAE